MNATVLAPSAECLALEVKQDAKQAPQQNKRGVCHYGGYKAVSDRPVSLLLSV